jgi:hypothetical protein
MDTTPAVEALAALFASTRAGERLRAMDALSVKRGGRIVRLVDDRRAIPLLIAGLGDADRRVQRAAARGLRPWLADEPALLDRVLHAYAGQSFDGSYSHAGLLDTRTSTVWVPRFAAVGGHAALLPDANTDRYFRFDFFLRGQAPRWVPGEGAAHLLLYLVPEWSYAQQRLIPEWDERALLRNRREQARYAEAVAEFYASCALAYDVHVHHVVAGGGHHRARELDVDLIRGRAPSSAAARARTRAR